MARRYRKAIAFEPKDLRQAAARYPALGHRAAAHADYRVTRDDQLAVK